MAPTKRCYSKEEIARRGDAIYEADVLPRLAAEDEGKFAAIDIKTGNFEIDLDERAACGKLNARIPDAQIWLVKIGSRYLHRFGHELKIQVRLGGKVTIKRLLGRSDHGTRHRQD